jgi:serine/threonine-protein kinase SRPK3
MSSQISNATSISSDEQSINVPYDFIGQVVHNHKYLIIRKIGMGAFAIVWMALDLDSISYNNELKFVAIKMQLPDRYMDAVDEISFIKQFHKDAKKKNHEGGRYIMPLLDTFDMPVPKEYLTPEMIAEEETVFCCMVMPLMACNLHYVLKYGKHREGLPLNSFIDICRQLFMGVDLIHKSKGDTKNTSIHSDLKPDNMLIYGITYETEALIEWLRSLNMYAYRMELVNKKDAQLMAKHKQFEMKMQKMHKVDRDTKQKFEKLHKQVRKLIESTDNDLASWIRAQLMEKHPEFFDEFEVSESTSSDSSRSSRSSKSSSSSSSVDDKDDASSDNGESDDSSSTASTVPDEHHDGINVYEGDSDSDDTDSTDSSSSDSSTDSRAIDVIDDKYVNHPHMCISDFGATVEKGFGEFFGVRTRYYMPPDNIIGYDMKSEKCDIWSVGCIMYELLTGAYLFDPDKSRVYSRDVHHLFGMIELLGNFPDSLVSKGKHYHTFFPNGRFIYKEEIPHTDLLDLLKSSRPDLSEEILSKINTVILMCLEYDPQKRASAEDLIKVWKSIF